MKTQKIKVFELSSIIFWPEIRIDIFEWILSFEYIIYQKIIL